MTPYEYGCRATEKLQHSLFFEGNNYVRLKHAAMSDYVKMELVQQVFYKRYKMWSVDVGIASFPEFLLYVFY